jgi:hypothetical protein
MVYREEESCGGDLQQEIWCPQVLSEIRVDKLVVEIPGRREIQEESKDCGFAGISYIWLLTFLR